jgi:hypothetical protein
MSEFKFACPVCGQHLTADLSSSGKQIECPTCFQAIVVPQAPASGDTKFILAASQANRPHRGTTGFVGGEPPRRSRVRGPVLTALLVLVLVGGAAGVIYGFRGKLARMIGRGGGTAPGATNAPPAAGR